MGLGYNFNSFSPFMQPTIGFGGWGSFSGSTTTETAEEKLEREKREEAKKAADEFAKRMELIKQREENTPKIEAQINELQTAGEKIDITVNKAKKGKEAADGSIKVKETMEDYNKLPWWKKTLRAGSNLVQGSWKLIEGFAGYEVNEKTGKKEWNWKKGLKNTVIAAGCIALTAIPVVGPVISTGLLATGVVCGTYGMAKGISKAMDAKTPEELDHAYQDIGSGLTIGFSSACGLRGLGKGLQASATTSTTSAVVRSTSKNAVMQFVKDATINAYRATVQGVQKDYAAVSANGFAKTWGANIRNMFKFGESKFEKERYDTNQSINDRLNKIDQELNNPTISQVEKSLLEREKLILDAQKTELRNVTTRDGWKNLRKDSQLHKDVKDLKTFAKELESNGSVEINGTTFNASVENTAAIQQAVKRSQELSKQIETLAKLRSSTIKKMAFYKRYASDVQAYTGKVRTNRFARVYDTIKIPKSEITWKKALMSPLKLGWELMALPFKPWGYVSKSSTSTFYKLQETFIPTYEAGLLDGFMGFGEQTLTTTVTQQNEKGETVEQEVAVTKDILSQLEEQKKQIDEALNKANEELGKLYIA